MNLEIKLMIEIFLLLLFLILGIKLIGKVIGLIVAFISWLIVGFLIFGFFLYPDYINYKDPSIYVKVDKIDEKSLDFLIKKGFIKNPKIEKLNSLDKNMKKKFMEELKKEIPQEIIIKKGNSKGKIYIKLSFLVNNPKLAEDLLNKKIKKEDIRILLKSYLNKDIILNPELKNKDLIVLIGKFWIK